MGWESDMHLEGVINLNIIVIIKFPKIKILRILQSNTIIYLIVLFTHILPPSNCCLLFFSATSFGKTKCI